MPEERNAVAPFGEFDGVADLDALSSHAAREAAAAIERDNH
jgi:hypothetical protein